MSKIKKLIVDNQGNITYDGQTINRKNINSTFLDKLFSDSLEKCVEFEIDNTDSISRLFLKIKEETDENSEFLKLYETKKEDLKKLIKEKETIEEAAEEKDLPDV